MERDERFPSSAAMGQVGAQSDERRISLQSEKVQQDHRRYPAPAASRPARVAHATDFFPIFGDLISRDAALLPRPSTPHLAKSAGASGHVGGTSHTIHCKRV